MNIFLDIVVLLTDNHKYCLSKQITTEKMVVVCYLNPLQAIKGVERWPYNNDKKP